jgi:hypothetical protein
MKDKLLLLLTIILASVLTLVFAEGVYALCKTKRYQTSITYAIYHWAKGHLAGEKDIVSWDPNSRTIIYSQIFERYIDNYLQDGIGLGNSYYSELRTERVNMNETRDGCMIQKPNLDKEMTYLRAGLYSPFAPVTAFYDKDTKLSPEVTHFLDRYAIRRIRHRTNDRGERLTLPMVESTKKVIVAGDSVANGAMLNDSETLASRLQLRNPDRQYVNIGIGGADATDIQCALDRAGRDYHGQIVELIYIYCENDFKDDKPMGQPEDVIAWLQEYVRSENIPRTTVIYAPYIYNIIPHITRFRGGYRGGRYETHSNERRRLEELTMKAGFKFVDIGALALAEVENTGTQYGPLLLFADEAHWSPAGSEHMAAFLSNEDTHIRK